MKTILAAIDFSPVTREVLAQSVSLARTVGARVVVVNVTAPPAYVPEDYGMNMTASVIAGSSEYALKELKRIDRDLKQKSIEATTFHAVGYPAAVVLQCAKKFAASFIVIGSHGHTALYDLVVGSTTQIVLKRATCPVLVVPAEPIPKARRAHKKSRPPR
jgi:nucleotide-binding universal stress UspA family protein